MFGTLPPQPREATCRASFQVDHAAPRFTQCSPLVTAASYGCTTPFLRGIGGSQRHAAHSRCCMESSESSCPADSPVRKRGKACHGIVSPAASCRQDLLCMKQQRSPYRAAPRCVACLSACHNLFALIFSCHDLEHQSTITPT